MKLPKNGIILETLLAQYGFEKQQRDTWPLFYVRNHKGLRTQYVLDKPYKNMVRFHIETRDSFGQAMPDIRELMSMLPPANGLGAWDYISKKQFDDILGLFADILKKRIMPRLIEIENAEYTRTPGRKENRYLYDNHLSLGEKFCKRIPEFRECSSKRGVEILVDDFLSHCRKDEEVDKEYLLEISAAFMDLVSRFYDVIVEWDERSGSCLCTYNKGSNHKQLIPAMIGYYMWYLLNEKEEAREWMLKTLYHDAVEDEEQ